MLGGIRVRSSGAAARLGPHLVFVLFGQAGSHMQALRCIPEADGLPCAVSVGNSFVYPLPKLLICPDPAHPPWSWSLE